MNSEYFKDSLAEVVKNNYSFISTILRQYEEKRILRFLEVFEELSNHKDVSLSYGDLSIIHKNG